MTAVYCFDTSGWIQTWNDLYPREVFPSLWENIEGLITADRIICPDEVFRELGRKDDGIAKWAKAQGKMFRPLEGDLLSKGIDITNRYPRLLDQKPGKNGADPWVIALAAVRGAVLVTQERPTGGLRSPKIPDVCKAEALDCVDVLEFIKRERWRW
jgi:hypothetical protein